MTALLAVVLAVCGMTLLNLAGLAPPYQRKHWGWKLCNPAGALLLFGAVGLGIWEMVA